MKGVDQTFPPSLKADDPKAFRVYAEKCPNSRGVRRVLEAVAASSEGDKKVLTYDQFIAALKKDPEDGGNNEQEWTFTS